MSKHLSWTSRCPPLHRSIRYASHSSIWLYFPAIVLGSCDSWSSQIPFIHLGNWYYILHSPALSASTPQSPGSWGILVNDPKDWISVYFYSFWISIFFPKKKSSQVFKEHIIKYHKSTKPLFKPLPWSFSSMLFKEFYSFKCCMEVFNWF